MTLLLFFAGIAILAHSPQAAFNKNRANIKVDDHGVLKLSSTNDILLNSASLNAMLSTLTSLNETVNTQKSEIAELKLAVAVLSADPPFKARTEITLAAVSPAANSKLGMAVAFAETLAVLGAPSESLGEGAVYVFARSQSGTSFAAPERLTATDESGFGVLFGTSVAISGELVIVGATKSSGLGFVEVFSKDNLNKYKSDATLKASDGKSGDRFGQSVASSGNTIVIGAVHEDSSGNNAGAVYVFELQSQKWTQIIKLLASDGNDNHGFGNTVAMNRAGLIVAGTQSADAAYVFEKNASNVYAETNKLSGVKSSRFGFSVAADGDLIVVGAPDDGTSPIQNGAVYLFQQGRPDASKLVASDGASGDWFGQSVDISGDLIVVGAPKHTHESVESGSSYVFQRNVTGSFVESTKLVGTNAADDDMMGLAVAVDGKGILIGVPEDDINGKTNAGSAIVFQ